MGFIPGHEDTPNSLTGRVIYLMTYITGLLVYIAYSAILISYLTVQPLVLPFTTLQGLLKTKEYSLGVLKNTADYDMFEVTLNTKVGLNTRVLFNDPYS